jgi:coenzyme F420 hydrogenase subunit beta
MTNQTLLRGGQAALNALVRQPKFCTACGACVQLCPYQAFYHDEVVTLHDCDLNEGRCFAFCPRTPTDLTALRRLLWEPQATTPEIGPVKGYLIARAADETIRRQAQHGGTVTALMSLALAEGLIDTAVLSEGADHLTQCGVAVQEAAEIRKRGKSKFIAAGTVAAFNRAAQGDAQKIGVVTTPCQALALAKMRLKPFPEKDNNIDKLKLVVGLFCGWTLSWRKFTALLKTRAPLESITGMDIPPGKGQVVLFTKSEPIILPWAEIDPLVREGCRICLDTTAEFADISVGSARLPEDWEHLRSWNQVIVRTETGQALMDLARRKGVLEFREVPASALEELKKAAWNKKKASLKTIVEKTGSPEDLIYVDPHDPVIGRMVGETIF